MPPRKPLRRPHRKSRLGCQECKRRHIKCDEAQPTCENCSRDDRPCAYQKASTPRAGSTQSPCAISDTTPAGSYIGSPMSQGVPILEERHSTASAAATPSVNLDYLSPIPSSFQTSDLALNMRHMQLFSHFIFETLPSLEETGSIDRGHIRIMMPIILSKPYVVYQLLALSAMHMSYIHTAEADRYREEARAFETQALSSFNDAHIEVTVENCAPMLIFSSFIGLHALAEVAATAESNAGEILDRFVTYMNLHRGVRAITSQSWQLLKQTSISPILERAESAISPGFSSHGQAAAAVADRLSSLLNQADMSEQSRETCSVAVSQLQTVFQTESTPRELSSQEQLSGLIWVWPINLSSDFTSLLSMRKPEALIILAHYAVLLRRRRRMWLVGNVGGILIEEISRFLGTFWKRWLEWPNEMLAQSQGDT